MPTFEERKRIDAVIAYEESAILSREQETLAAGNNLVAGTVLGRLANGNLTAFNHAADPAHPAVGVLFEDVDATDGAKPCVAWVRNAVFKEGGIVWTSTPNAGQKAAAVAQLNAAGLTIRTDL